MPPLVYSQLVVIRVSHEDPLITNHAATVMREELASVLEKVVKEIDPTRRPSIEVLNVGNIDDFPFREISRC